MIEEMDLDIEDDTPARTRALLLPLPLPVPGKWYEQGACKGAFEDGFNFFSDDRTTEGQIDVRRAKDICALCTVRDECLTYALENRVKHGVWGGLTERERRRTRARRRVSLNPRTTTAVSGLNSEARRTAPPLPTPESCPACKSRWVAREGNGRARCLKCENKWPAPLQ